MKHDKHLHAQEGWQLSTRTALRINGLTAAPSAQGQAELRH